MRSYALNKEEEKSFVLNYEVKNKEIIIHFASGEQKRIPYSLEREKNLLNHMKEQIKNSKEFKRKEENQELESAQKILLSSGLFSLNLFLLHISKGSLNQPFFEGMVACSALITILESYKIINSIKNINDIHKNN